MHAFTTRQERCLMKFYDCKTAPSSRLVRMFIAEKGLDITSVEVDLRSGAHLQAEFKERNPYCTVPIIETDSGLNRGPRLAY
jgi:glutathione S-transferase